MSCDKISAQIERQYAAGWAALMADDYARHAFHLRLAERLEVLRTRSSTELRTLHQALHGSLPR